MYQLHRLPRRRRPTDRLLRRLLRHKEAIDEMIADGELDGRDLEQLGAEFLAK